MIYTLDINKEHTGQYKARALNAGAAVVEIRGPTISGVIRDSAAWIVPGLYGFHIWYGHVSIGTASLHTMRHDAETLAQRLVSLHSQSGG